ncbi:MAG: chorismate mutase, partial [Exiguobacterium sp.]
MSPQDQLNRLRREMDELNHEMLDLLSRRGTLAVEIGKIKRLQGVERYDPVREREMLDFIAASNQGPFETSRLQHIFKEVFKASAEL